MLDGGSLTSENGRQGLDWPLVQNLGVSWYFSLTSYDVKMFKPQSYIVQGETESQQDAWCGPLYYPIIDPVMKIGCKEC